MVAYTVYLFCLEILHKRTKRLYETPLFRLLRIHFNLAMIALLILLAPPIASGYLWFFFSMPIFAVLLYFGRFSPLLIIYLEVCTAILVLTFAQGRPTPLGVAAMIAQDAILGLLAAILYLFVYFFPWLRAENALLKASTTLIQVLDQRELCQLLADVAKAGVLAADAAVVHLLGGESNRTLVPAGSSRLDLTVLGRTPMEIGKGIAGHAIQNRETISVRDVHDDDRYLELAPSLTPFTSLLVAPMYVGEKNVGTISVHSARKGAFSERGKRFLTALAAQGATAIANAELYDIRTQRRQQISEILEASRNFGLHQSLDTLLETIAKEVCRCSGYRMAAVNLLDESGDEIVVRAMAGVPPEGRSKLQDLRIPLDVVKPLLQEKFRVSQSYFIRYDRCPEVPDLDQYTFTPDLGERKPGEWHQEDILIVPIRTQEEKLVGYLSVDDPDDQQLPSLDIIQALEILSSVAATAIENAHLYEQAQKEIAERRRVEESLAREQHLLQTFMNNVPDNIYFKDTESRFIRINRALADRFGLSDLMQAIDKTDFDFFTDEHAQQAYADEQDVIRTGQPLDKEEKETWPDGRVTWVATTKMPLRDERGHIVGTFGISKDITERRRREIRLQEYLSTVMNSLARHTSLEGLYSFIVETGVKLLSARDCSLFFFSDENTNTLELVAKSTSSPHANRRHTIASVDPQCGLVAHVVGWRQPVRLLGREMRQHPLWNAELWARLGWGFDPESDHSLLAAPICASDGCLLGVLVALDAESDRGFSGFDETLLQTLATNAAADIGRVRGLEKTREEAIRAERKRLETDLHEAMNVLATGVRWEADILSDEIDRNNLAAARIALTRLQAARTRAYTDLRYLLEDLRDPTLEQEGLLTALRKRAEVGRGRILVQGGFGERLPPKIEGALYRVGQEAMSNAVKHSGFTRDPDVRIEVWLETRDEQVKLYVKDDGVGFDVKSIPALSHKWGLRRLRDMLREMGGRLEIDSAPGKGTKICAIIDLTKRNHEQ